MNLPTFLIVGAARSGTTSLYYYLKKHPDIYMCKQKEPCFFAFANEDVKFLGTRVNSLVTVYEDYLELFQGGEKFKCRGEASTPYLYFYDKTIRNIKKYVRDYGNLKIIIILRNPVERTYSQYLHRVKNLHEKMTFEEAIALEKSRIQQNYFFDYFYTDRSFYFKQVRAYLKNFKFVKIYLYEDFEINPEGLIKDIFEFLEVDKEFKCDVSKKYNVSGIPKIKSFHNHLVKDSIIKKIGKRLLPENIRNKYYEKISNLNHKFNLQKMQISEQTREYLLALFREDITMLSNLIDRDLSIWLK